jgi:hypothetical protein
MIVLVPLYNRCHGFINRLGLFSRIRRRAAYHCIKKEVEWLKIAIQTHTHPHTHPGFKIQTRPYQTWVDHNYHHTLLTTRSSATRPDNPLAPASIQRSASFCARRRAWSILGEAPLNTISFLNFQRTQSFRTVLRLQLDKACIFRKQHNFAK